MWIIFAVIAIRAMLYSIAVGLEMRVKLLPRRLPLLKMRSSSIGLLIPYPCYSTNMFHALECRSRLFMTLGESAPPPKSPFCPPSLRSLPNPSSLSEKDAREELLRIARTVIQWDEAYYGEDKPLVSDEEYDALIRRNEAIESRFPSLKLPTSPSSRIGASSTFMDKTAASDGDSSSSMAHLNPMLSLDSAPDEKALHSFIRRLGVGEQLVGEPKIDGLSCGLIYQEGQLSYASTRGDGITGEDVTATVLSCGFAPKKLLMERKTEDGTGEVQVPRKIEIRGEVYLPRDSFNDLNNEREARGEERFATLRNAAAGSLRQLDPLESSQKRLSFFAYDAVTENGQWEKDEVSCQWNLLSILKCWGFSIANPLLPPTQSIDEVFRFHKKVMEQRFSMHFEVDGVVYKANDIELRKSLGATSRAPRWAVAYKFPALEANTILQGIDFQIGRQGTVTPVAVLKPVLIGGVEVERASLYNEDELERLCLKKGDVVRVIRAGDVIPKVEENLGSSSPANDKIEETTATNTIVLSQGRGSSVNTFSMPSLCPSCGGDLKRIEGEAAVRCMAGYNCPAQAIERLRYFCSRAAMNIDGLGSERLKQLYSSGIVSRPADIYRLGEKRKDLEKIPGWGKQSIENVLNAVEASRSSTLSRVLIGLGFPGMGINAARLVSEEFHGDWKSLWSILLKSGQEEEDDEFRNSTSRLCEIPGVGPVLVKKMVSFVQHFESRVMVEDLMNALRVSSVPKHESNSASPEQRPFAGKTVVVSGRFSGMTRAKMEDTVRSLGGRVTSSITRRTDLVLLGMNAGPEKLRKCKELGVKTMYEDVWNELLFNLPRPIE